MCGFAGFIAADFKLGKEEVISQLTKMSDQIVSRGPDSFGHWSDESASIALTHRRLAILDLSDAGHQPFTSKSGRYVIAYNGEIYHHLDLRKELNKRDWIGSSDTETHLACIEKYGLERTLPKINGMFAFALWDKERELSLARDRIGEKPLYYGWQNDTFCLVQI